MAAEEAFFGRCDQTSECRIRRLRIGRVPRMDPPALDLENRSGFDLCLCPHRRRAAEKVGPRCLYGSGPALASLPRRDTAERGSALLFRTILLGWRKEVPPGLEVAEGSGNVTRP